MTMKFEHLFHVNYLHRHYGQSNTCQQQVPSDTTWKAGIVPGIAFICQEVLDLNMAHIYPSPPRARTHHHQVRRPTLKPLSYGGETTMSIHILVPNGSTYFFYFSCDSDRNENGQIKIYLRVTCYETVTQIDLSINPGILRYSMKRNTYSRTPVRLYLQ